MNAANPYQRLELWETLKSHVLALVPRAHELIAEAAEERWRTLSVFECQLVALMVVLDRDLRAPSVRRQSRTLLKKLLGDFGLGEEHKGSTLESVREEGTEFDEKLLGPIREKLKRSLAWIAAEPPSKSLAAVSGPQAAAAMVSRNAPALDGVQAHRWLAALGFPMAVPDASRQRVMARLGWIASSSQTAGARRMALAAMESMAQESSATLAEVGIVLGLFAGEDLNLAGEAALCGVKPKCEACPITSHCSYFRQAAGQSDRVSRSFAATTLKEHRPREKFLSQGPGALGDDELLAILLRTGSGEENALDLARRIMKKAESLDRLAKMSVKEITDVCKGVGDVKAITIKAAFELAQRTAKVQTGGDRLVVKSSRTIFEHLRPRFLGEKKEHFLVLITNTKMEVTRIVTVSTGTLNQSLVHPREVFAEAVRDSAFGVLFAHNHPSGDPEPSREDIAITRKLVKAGEVMSIRVLDHIIVGAERYYSFADEGKLSE